MIAKNLLFPLFLIFFSFNSFAQYQTKEKPFLIKIDGKYIFAYKNGTLAFPEAFDGIFEHVCYNNELTPAAYYSEHRNYVVVKNGKYGVLKDLNYFVTPEYDLIISNGCNNIFPYFGLKNNRMNFITANGKPGKEYDKIEATPFAGIYRITEKGRQKLIHRHMNDSMVDYTSKSYEKINVIISGHLILEEKGTKSMCVVSSFDNKDDFKCIPAAKCEYYYNADDEIAQVFPGNPVANIYYTGLNLNEKRKITKTQLEEEYALFEDDANFSLTDYMSSMPLKMLEGIAEEAGINVDSLKNKKPSAEQIRNDMKEKISNPTKQEYRSQELRIKIYALAKDTTSANLHGVILTYGKPAMRGAAQKPPTIVTPKYDEIYLSDEDLKNFIKFRKGREFGLLDWNGREIFNRTWKEIEFFERANNLIIAKTQDSSYLYRYEDDSSRLTLLHEDLNSVKFKLVKSQVFIYRKSSEIRPQGFISFIPSRLAYEFGADFPVKVPPRTVSSGFVYDSIAEHPLMDNFFLTYKNGKTGIMSWDLHFDLPAVYDSLQFHYIPERERNLHFAFFAFKGDSASYYIINKEFPEANFDRKYVACMDQGIPFVAESGDYFYTKKDDGLYEILNRTGKLLTKKHFKNVSAASSLTKEFWYIEVEDASGEKYAITPSGVEFHLPE